MLIEQVHKGDCPRQTSTFLWFFMMPFLPSWPHLPCLLQFKKKIGPAWVINNLGVNDMTTLKIYFTLLFDAVLLPREQNMRNFILHISQF